MKNHNGNNETNELNANLRHWKKLLKELPDVRVDKINSAKQAIENHQYDDDSVVEVTLERLCSEMKTS